MLTILDILTGILCMFLGTVGLYYSETPVHFLISTVIFYAGLRAVYSPFGARKNEAL